MIRTLPLIARPLLLTLTAATLSACQTMNVASSPPAAPPAAAEVWLALGTEPFWSIEVTPTHITYNDPENRMIRVANPGAVATTSGTRYTTRRIAITATPQPCSDGMSDRRYRDTVRAIVDGRTLSGCGGPVLSPASVEGTGWRIVSINGTPVAPGRQPAELAFRDGTLSGTSGCNRLTGSYSIVRGRISFGPIAMTRMACPDPLMAQESALATLLGGPLAIRSAPDGMIDLVRDGAGSIRLGPWL